MSFIVPSSFFSFPGPPLPSLPQKLGPFCTQHPFLSQSHKDPVGRQTWEMLQASKIHPRLVTFELLGRGGIGFVCVFFSLFLFIFNVFVCLFCFSSPLLHVSLPNFSFESRWQQNLQAEHCLTPFQEFPYLYFDKLPLFWWLKGSFHPIESCPCLQCPPRSMQWDTEAIFLWLKSSILTWQDLHVQTPARVYITTNSHGHYVSRRGVNVLCVFFSDLEYGIFCSIPYPKGGLLNFLTYILVSTTGTEKAN